jgi:spindle assembly abnormal protein 6
MPLFIDDDPRMHDSFDIQTASTLYWKSVPVLVRHADREDVAEQLTVRILSGVQKQNHSLRVLRVYLSSEADLFFLHTLEVTEEDFQNLKVEQGILVDFANFPGKIISLLEKCIAAQDVDSPRYCKGQLFCSLLMS